VPPIVHDVLRSPDQPNNSESPDTQSHSARQDSSPEKTGAKITSGGAGTVVTTYAPEEKDKSTKIVFIQVMRGLLDGIPVKPSEEHPSFAYRDADTTSDFYHVDYVSGEKDPYFNGDDPKDVGTQGNAVSTPSVAAQTLDKPNYYDNNFPPGKSKIRFDFTIAAFSAAGADAGTFYERVFWYYNKEKGKPGTTLVGGTYPGNPDPEFINALNLWNTNHGFKIPSTGSVPSGGGPASPSPNVPSGGGPVPPSPRQTSEPPRE
jgi:hypothetical protein